ncbi:hypothetical protein [Tenacibaculum sp. 190524A02b]|uniref:hypothetical protein n=1 Tax=Tenacibaculum vairaonense TaxID=3137860 RepID=UPI0031FAEC3F
MKKVIMAAAVLVVSFTVNAQDLVSGGSNSWVFHTPDNGSTIMAIAPKIDGEWNWSKETRFYNDGLVTFQKIKSHSQFLINPASTGDNNSPGVTLVSNDDFLYDGKYINHYGFGFHDFQEDSNSLNGNNAYISGYFGIDLFTGGHNRFRIKNNGNVGIGTVNPDSKLTVNGTIHSKEVRVDLQIPADYVFEKYYEGASTLKADYKMPTLEEVEAFTKKNHHLPAIPSAAKIQEEGLHLKEMTNLLLQKIEELTLYTIEQEKRIKTLEKKLATK